MGYLLELKQDFAGVGGDVNFIRTTFDPATTYPLFGDFVLMLRGQAGNIASWGGEDLRILDNFFKGPDLVRGFEPNGIGPRDLASGGGDLMRAAGCAGRHALLGHDGGNPVPALLPAQGSRPEGGGVRRCRFAVGLPAVRRPSSANVARADDLTDCSLSSRLRWHQGQKPRRHLRRRQRPDPLLGRRQPDLEVALRPAALRLCLGAVEGRLRPDPGVPLQRRHQVLIHLILAISMRRPGSPGRRFV